MLNCCGSPSINLPLARPRAGVFRKRCDDVLMTVLAQRARMVTSTEVLVAAMVLCAFAGAWMRNGVAGNAPLATAGTVFCGVFLQAVPFLVLGVLVSGLVETFVSRDRLARWLPRRPAGAVLAGGSGRRGSARV